MDRQAAPEREAETKQRFSPEERGRLQTLLHLAVAIGRREGLLGRGGVTESDGEGSAPAEEGEE